MSGVLTPSPPITLSSVNNYKSDNQYAFSSVSHHGSSNFLDLKIKKQLGLRFDGERLCHTISLRCNSTTGPGGPASDDNESKNVLDAFFLGKALAEAVNERIESAVGEFLSTIGRLQAEQQRQIQDFQEDVLERAKKAKENAAREALEAQGLVRKPPTIDAASTTYGATSSTVTRNSSPSSPNSTVVPAAQTGSDSKGPAFEPSSDD